MKRVRNFVPFITLAYKYCQKKCEAPWLRWPKTSIILSMSFPRVLSVYSRSMQRREMLLRVLDVLDPLWNEGTSSLIRNPLKVPISLRGSLRIWKEHKKLINKFFNIFSFSSIVSEIWGAKHGFFKKFPWCLGETNTIDYIHLATITY